MHGIDKIKQISAVLLAMLLLSVLSVPAFADEGRPIGNFAEGNTYSTSSAESTDTSGGGEQLIYLSGGVSYGAESGLMYRDVGNSRFGINVPDGAVVTEPVSVSLAPSLTGVLYKNGVEISDADLSHITDSGKYILAVTANDSTQSVRLGFTILSSPSGQVKEYEMPDDFYVVSATLNGEEASYSQTYVDMSSDGDYVINYRSPEAKKDMQLVVTVDHTPPTATLTGITDGKANGPVTVTDVEEGVQIHLTRNGEQTTYTGTISKTGAYVLTLRDSAGNQTAYDFVVVTYANTSVKALLATGGVLVLALLGYIIYYGKYIRVS